MSTVAHRSRHRARRNALLSLGAATLIWSGMSAAAPSSADAATPVTYTIRPNGSSWQAVVEGTVKYSGTLKYVVETASASLSATADGGTVYFPAGQYNLGDQWFRLKNVHRVTFEGAGMDQTFISNDNSTAQDTEPFNFSGAFNVTIRNLNVAARGSARSSSDALDFDQGNDSLVENVKITASRSKGIIFDGKNADWTSTNNIIRNNIIENTNASGIELLASSSNLVTGNIIRNVGRHGIHINKAASSGDNIQWNKPSNSNLVENNTVDNSGYDGVNITSGNNNIIRANLITNSGNLATGSGIKVTVGNSINADDNRIESNTATDNQAVKTQEYGVFITSTLCHRTVLIGNTLTGNRRAAIRDDSGTPDTTPPSAPGAVVASGVTAYSAHLSWAPSTDNIGVTGYRLYRDGVLINSGTTTAFDDAGLEPSTNYTYTVQATDAAGNVSSPSPSSVVTTAAGARILSFQPTDDATIDQANPTLNYGTNTRLTVDNSPVNDALLKFSVQGIGAGTTCPSVGSASLKLTVGEASSDASTKGGAIYRTQSTSWTQSTVNWNTAPAADSTPLASITTSVAINTTYSVDVTSAVAGNGVLSLRMKGLSSDGARYLSKEASTTTPPVLNVTCGG